MLRRISPADVSLERLRDALWRRIKNVPDWAAWRARSAESLQNRERLAGFRDLHLDQRCFILGNGPSLSRMDLAPLAKEITFGLNRIYLAFDRLNFVPTYYVCVNELVLEQFADEIRAIRTWKFLNWNRRAYFPSEGTQTVFLRLALGLQDRFGREPQHGLWGGGTVTYAAMQLAYFMGFREVVLIGLDHTYAAKGVPNTTRVRGPGPDTDHFDSTYFPAGTRWQLPDLRRSEMAYALARSAFEKDGRRILDATDQGLCPVFEKIRFESLF